MAKSPKKNKTVVGIRELKSHLSTTIDQVKNGKAVTITEHHRPVAVMLPLAAASPETTLTKLAQAGRIRWDGGKPQGLRRAPQLTGTPLADAVLEDRR